MFKNLLLLSSITSLVLSVLCSCASTKSPRKLSKSIGATFTNRFEGRPTGLSARLDLNGYHHITYLLKYHNGTEPDTLTNDLLFYEDGSCVTTLFQGETRTDSLFHDAILKGKVSYLYRYFMWGIYSIKGDTIIAQFLAYPSRFVPDFKYERRFIITPERNIQITNDYAVQPVATKSFIEVPGTGFFARFFQAPAFPVSDYPDILASGVQTVFVPLHNIPAPLQWMKDRKFFWRHEEDWGRYMEVK